MARIKQIRTYHKYFTLKILRGVWKVFYKHNPGKQVSTGLKADKHPEADAIDWAFQHMYMEKPELKNDIPTLKAFAGNFFIEGPNPEKPICPFLSWLKNRKKKYSSEYASGHRGRLMNYILPRFGSLQLAAIDEKDVFEWVINLKSCRNKKELADDSKNKIITIFKMIMDFAKYERHIPENPLKDLKEITPDAEEREPFLFEEIKQLFPSDRDKLMAIWGYEEQKDSEKDQELKWRVQMWITYFMTEAVTGWRPGEVGGLRLGDRISKKLDINGEAVELQGIAASNSVDNINLNIKAGIKTSKKGVKVKVVLLTQRLIEEFDQLLLHKQLNNDDCDLWFHIGSRAIRSETANKHFKKSVERAGIDRRGRTQYCLRHSLATDLHGIAGESLVNEVMGHTRYRREYDHRDGVALLKKQYMNDIHSMLEEIRDL